MPENIMDEGQFKGYEEGGARVCETCGGRGCRNEVRIGRPQGGVISETTTRVECPACDGTGRRRIDDKEDFPMGVWEDMPRLPWSG